jgi:hypothetical protein
LSESPSPSKAPTRLAISIGLSPALAPLKGLVLDYTRFDIRLLPAVISIAAMSVVFVVLALVRKHAYNRLARACAEAGLPSSEKVHVPLLVRGCPALPIVHDYLRPLPPILARHVQDLAVQPADDEAVRELPALV